MVWMKKQKNLKDFCVCVCVWGEGAAGLRVRVRDVAGTAEDGILLGFVC